MEDKPDSWGTEILPASLKLRESGKRQTAGSGKQCKGTEKKRLRYEGDIIFLLENELHENENNRETSVMFNKLHIYLLNTAVRNPLGKMFT